MFIRMKMYYSRIIKFIGGKGLRASEQQIVWEDLRCCLLHVKTDTEKSFLGRTRCQFYGKCYCSDSCTEGKFFEKSGKQ